MKRDAQKTKVRFLYHEAEEDLFAFFPEQIHTTGGDSKVCYSTIGQHSSCSESYAEDCRDATASEYKELKAELESLGYNLDVLNS